RLRGKVMLVEILATGGAARADDRIRRDLAHLVEVGPGGHQHCRPPAISLTVPSTSTDLDQAASHRADPDGAAPEGTGLGPASDTVRRFRFGFCHFFRQLGR